MKIRYNLAAGLILLMGLVVGCSGKEPEEAPAVAIENIKDMEETVGEEQPENEAVPDSNVQSEEDVRQEQEEENVYKISPNKEGEESLSGKVKSIGENSVIISKIFVEDGEDGNSSIVIFPGEGGREEELVTVNFTDATEFHHWTIKSGGGDIDMRGSSFSEIAVGSGLEMSGNYDGDTFIARKVIIEVYE
ncbi:MAG: hypothetical protein HDR20_06200 [Lachnospiraceae bacterium]|nr:hypothetical protein [Lachnospiraceae bacterium]